MDKETLETLIIGSSFLAMAFLSWTGLSYHLTNKQDMKSYQTDGLINSRFYIKRDLDGIETENWFTRNIICLGEKLAHKKYLKVMGP